MIYDTVGIEYHKGYEHPIKYIPSLEITENTEENCFRILLLEQGACTVNLNNKAYHLKAPTLLCLNEFDETVFLDNNQLNIKAIYFHPKIINPYFDYKSIRATDYYFTEVQQQDLYLLYPFLLRNNYSNGIYHLEDDTFDRVQQLTELIGRELVIQKDNAWPCRSRSYYLELLIKITKIYDSKQECEDKNIIEIPEDIDEILNFLHNNYQMKITLDQLSIRFATNRTTLNNRFYKLTNLSVIDYLIKYRIDVAATLLRDTMLPISEIIVRIGFNNNPHFWRTFKKYNSLTPSEYRELNCWVR